MAVLRNEPYGNSNFLVHIDGLDPTSPAAGFREVALPEGTIAVVQYRAGNFRQAEPLLLPGGVHYEPVVLTRGANGSLDLYQWWNEVRNGVRDVRDVVIELLDESRTQTVLRWRLLRAWPTRHAFSSLHAETDDLLLETVELVYERLEVD